MSQAQGVDIAALISQLEDDYNIFGHHFISRMKQVLCYFTPYPGTRAQSKKRPRVEKPSLILLYDVTAWQNKVMKL